MSTRSHPVDGEQVPRPGSGEISGLDVLSPTAAVRASLLVLLVTVALAMGVGSEPSLGASDRSGESQIVVVDDEGREVAIASVPQRIVSLTPGTTEILFALGVGDRVVATTDADDFPPEAVPLPDVASFGTVDLERIVDLEPDLVIAGGNGYTPTDAIDRLRSLGYPVLVIYAASVDAVAEDIELIGRAVGADAAAEETAGELRTAIAVLSELVADEPRPRVFYEVDATVEIYGPADESFLAEMVELAGGTPITSGSASSFEVPLERLIVEDPEVIVLGDAAYGTTPQDVADRPGWSAMTAVREGAVRPVADILVTRPGPRLALGLRDLIEAIHPGVLR